MLVLDRATRKPQQKTFLDLPRYLDSKDLLIFNDSRVMPARLFGRRGQLEVELLLLKDLSAGRWEAIGRPLRKLKKDDIIIFSENLSARFISRTEEDGALVEFSFNSELATRAQVLEVGLMPIPPYIREGRSDKQDSVDYQSQFAKIEGSIAAPTASLHFTGDLLGEISKIGCAISFLTLHVGLSSIREIDPGKPPGSERFNVTESLLDQIAATKTNGGRVVAVGTTVVRALESAVLAESGSKAESTDLFILPGFEFKVVDVMITNFHMPGSTHLLLVESFLKEQKLLADAYDFAINNEFRFLSYGDGMMII